MSQVIFVLLNFATVFLLFSVEEYFEKMNTLRLL